MMLVCDKEILNNIRFCHKWGDGLAHRKERSGNESLKCHSIVFLILTVCLLTQEYKRVVGHTQKLSGVYHK